jgi:hypothetical protein
LASALALLERDAYQWASPKTCRMAQDLRSSNATWEDAIGAACSLSGTGMSFHTQFFAFAKNENDKSNFNARLFDFWNLSSLFKDY